MSIAILGWGSLLWDRHEPFDRTHDEWRTPGPCLPLEFSRVSQVEPRRGLLTLVVDPVNGSPCDVAYCFSARSNIGEVVADLASRERMKGQKNIGYVDLRGGDNRFRDESTGLAIRSWAAKNAIDIVVWTDLPSNFAEVARCPFSVGAAVSHLRRLGSDTQKRAAEYFAKAPLFIETPLRKALQD